MAEKSVKEQVDKRLKELKDSGANKALMDDAKRWLELVTGTKK